MKFCTVINCMDGRVQLPVIRYLKNYFGAEYVDSITEAGANLILSEQKDNRIIESILKKIDISIHKHASGAIAVSGHYDCAANPSDKDTQIEHIRKSVKFLRTRYKDMEIAGLWVDENWEVHQVSPEE